MAKSYYQILGLPQTSTPKDIKKAYKQLALKHHPDKNPQNKQYAKERFTKIAEAYDVLSDPDKRAAYDQKLQADARSEVPEKSGSHYAWKNPEFDPKFDHLADMPEHFENFGKHGGFPEFGFFSSKWLQTEFGSFTFDMAQEVFDRVFKDMDKNLKELQADWSKAPSQALHQNGHQFHPPVKYQEPPQNAPKLLQSISDYQPKNSTLLQEKTIERNGKRILVKKYNVTEQGVSHKEIREIILGNV